MPSPPPRKTRGKAKRERNAVPAAANGDAIGTLFGLGGDPLRFIMLAPDVPPLVLSAAQTLEVANLILENFEAE